MKHTFVSKYWKRRILAPLLSCGVLLLSIQPSGAQCGNLVFSTQTEINQFPSLACDGIVASDITIIDDNDGVDPITNLDGLAELRAVGNLLVIASNPHLGNLDGLSNLRTLEGGLFVLNNRTLESFCGLYGLLATPPPDGLKGTYNVVGNLVNPSISDILAAGPCVRDVFEELMVLLTFIDSSEVPRSVQSGLYAMAFNSTEILSDENPDNDVAACNQLMALVRQIQAQTPRKIDPIDAEFMLAQATLVLQILGCEQN